jgi:hypothetical protein
MVIHKVTAETNDAVLGATFGDTLDCPEAVAVHCSPHSNPFGQQFPPRFAGQLYHALGHDPPCGAPTVATPAPVGAMMTTPFVLMMVEVGIPQLPVVWQSRPTLQQPDG